MALQVFTHLDDVPLHYDRFAAESGFGYGTRGKPFKPRATPAMITRLQSCFADIFAQQPLGRAEVITSAGAYVQKEGFHGSGDAFDLDGIHWKSEKFIALEFPKKPHLYLAIESVVRKYFGTVLAYHYNTAHQDHLHLDSGTAVGFQKMSKSRVEYLQATLLYIHGYHIGIDGVWGPSTEKITRVALDGLNIDGSVSSLDTWLAYLKVTAAKAFNTVGS